MDMRMAIAGPWRNFEVHRRSWLGCLGKNCFGVQDHSSSNRSGNKLASGQHGFSPFSEIRIRLLLKMFAGQSS
jgi:hypothetical protein